MRRYRILTSLSGPSICLNPGATVTRDQELSGADLDRLVASGQAEEIPLAPNAPLETATLEPAENGAVLSRRPRGRNAR